MHTSNQILIIIFLQLIIGCNGGVDKKETKSKGMEKVSTSRNIKMQLESEKRSPLLVSKDFGMTWISASEGLPNEIQVSFLEQKGNEIVIATDNMGLFISNNKTKWESIGDKLPNQKINALYISNETIYVGVYRNGIYKTEDDGKSWKSLNHNLTDLNIQSICKYKNRLFIGTDTGLKILNSERTWQSTLINAQVLSIYEYDGKLIAGTSRGNVISKDAGKNWTWIRKAGAVHYTHNIGNRIIELALNGDLFYSDDWGKNWKEIEYKPRFGSYIYEIVEIDKYQLLSNNYGIHRSMDDGQTWEHIFKTESIGFFDFIVIGKEVYGGTRTWDEYRKRNK